MNITKELSLKSLEAKRLDCLVTEQRHIILELRKEVSKLRAVAEAALRVLVPSHGRRGGPLIQLVAYYEDGSPFSEYDKELCYDFWAKDMYVNGDRMNNLRQALHDAGMESS